METEKGLKQLERMKLWNNRSREAMKIAKLARNAWVRSKDPEYARVYQEMFNHYIKLVDYCCNRWDIVAGRSSK